MSEKNRKFYQVFTIVLWLVAVAAGAAMWYFSDMGKVWQLPVFLIVMLLLPLSVLVHELGHLIVGGIAGMRFYAFRIGNFVIRTDGGKVRLRYNDSSAAAGETTFVPKSPRRMRERFLWTALGGACFNLIFGAVMLVLYFVLPNYPALLFFELFAPLSLCEGICALIPAELPAGKTDGAVALGIMKKDADELVALAVLTAQGMLQKGSYRDIPRELLFDTPVVREDSVVFLALLQLRWQYLFVTDGENALAPLERLAGLYDELPEQARAEVADELAYIYTVVAPDPERAALFAEDAAGGTLISALNGDEGLAKAKALAEAERIAGAREYKLKLLSRLEK